MLTVPTMLDIAKIIPEQSHRLTKIMSCQQQAHLWPCTVGHTLAWANCFTRCSFRNAKTHLFSSPRNHNSGISSAPVSMPGLAIASQLAMANCVFFKFVFRLSWNVFPGYQRLTATAAHTKDTTSVDAIGLHTPAKLMTLQTRIIHLRIHLSICPYHDARNVEKKSTFKPTQRSIQRTRVFEQIMVEPRTCQLPSVVRPTCLDKHC